MNKPAVLVLCLCGGCVGHILPYTPKVRSYPVGEYAQTQRTLSPDSIYVDGTSWLADPRSTSLGDVITVRIEEGESGVHRASTKLSREHNRSEGMPALLHLASALSKAVPGLDPKQLLAIGGSNKHEGVGETSRTGQVAATLPVRVKRVLPNGDLYIEGNKVVLVNSEEHHLYLSGVVRAIDLAADNSVSSGRIADLQVELTGRGVVSEKQNPGWASRVLDYVWPF